LLLTGSAGYLGQSLYKKLKSDGYDIFGIDQIATETTQFVGDISNRAFVAECLNNQPIDVIIHTATLHKPHVSIFSKQDFVNVNITGTLNLLEEAVLHNVKKFIFTSTTAVFGLAMIPTDKEGASWITEEVAPIPKNIYGVTKIAAENMCHLFSQQHKMNVIVLRTSRFFPEEDDEDRGVSEENCKANELLYRRGDLRDMVDAHVLAVTKIDQFKFEIFIISAPTPFQREDRHLLWESPAKALVKYFPDFEKAYEKLNWKLLKMDRVYVTEKAQKVLGFQAKYSYEYHLNKNFQEIFELPPRQFAYNHMKK